MKTLRLIASVLSAVLITASFDGCASSKRDETASNTGKYSSVTVGEYTESGKMCENSRFELYWNAEKKFVYFKDKTNGNVYSAIASGSEVPTYDEDGILKKNNPLTESAILVYYFDGKSLSEKNVSVGVDIMEEGDAYTEIIDDGLRVIYDFQGAEISVPVDYKLRADSFTATVVTDEIKDSGENYVTAVALAPFSCSVKNDTADSWLLLPDGSGTLLSTESTDLIGTQGSMAVYGVDPTVQSYHLESYTKQVSMPVFGMKNGDDAVFGIIESGAEGAEIAWNIGAENIGYSSVYPFFRIRGYNLIHAPSGFTTTEVELKSFSDYINTTPLTVAYYPMTGNNADYNSMAQVYRNYLINNGMLEKSDKAMPTVSLKLLGGVQTKKYTFGIPRTVLYSLTDVSDVREITEYFSERLDNDFLINLIGFGKTGLDFGEPGGGFKIASSLGSKKQVKALTALCRKKGIPVFADFDVIAFNKSGAGFKLVSDTATFPNGQKAYDVRKNYVIRKETDYRYNLLSRSMLDEAVESAVNAVVNYGFSGASLSSLSNTAYSDYKSKKTFVSGGMAEQVSKILSAAVDKTEIMTSSPNAYAVSSSTYATDAPTFSSGLDVSFMDIPFYSLVFRGYTPLSGESVNLASNGDKLILRCIESGIPLTYTVYANYDSSLISIEQSAISGGRFDGNKERIVEAYELVKEIYSKIGTAAIKKHTVTENGLRITEFDNGVRVAVNETETDLSFNGITVEGMSFKEITEG